MDPHDDLWDKFFDQRTRPLWERFLGYYRAVVVETDDPLASGRVRVKCPDLHDADLEPADCPWAVPAPEYGGRRAGSWSTPCIGDWLWITFERGHPYAPVWVGFATPTRRKMYPYPAVAGPTPLPVDEAGQPARPPDDFDPAYLPRDRRPMSHGTQDRYGNLDISSAVGFFPAEHRRPPPPPDFDPVLNERFAAAATQPIQNDPDGKFMLRLTKYGNMLVLGDQGYWWDNSRDDGYGEFSGDQLRDEAFEIRRWKYYQRLVNEGRPAGADNRRWAASTRYGHKFEMRDTGWAQPGPLPSKSRPGEFGPEVFLSRETTSDFRWIKLRTKDGMLWQASDMGSDPARDLFIRRPLVDEVGDATEREGLHWAGRDARWIRSVTRHGIKIVQDDRGSSLEDAAGRELPRGHGVLIKGRRTPGAGTASVQGDERGYFWEFNERDDMNHTAWGTPLGQTVEMNDAMEYMLLTAAVPGYSMPYKGLRDNEFLDRPLMAEDPERDTFHLKLDHANAYLRLKTAGGRGRRPNRVVNPVGLAEDGLQQGLEAHDGRNGDGPWCELVDGDGRGLWFSRGQQLGVWRARQGANMEIILDDGRRRLVISNRENGSIQISCAGSIDIAAGGDLNLRADGQIRFRSGRAMVADANGGYLHLDGTMMQTSVAVRVPRLSGFVAGVAPAQGGQTGAGSPDGGGAPVARIDSPAIPATLAPSDRGRVYNTVIRPPTATTPRPRTLVGTQPPTPPVPTTTTRQPPTPAGGRAPRLTTPPPAAPTFPPPPAEPPVAPAPRRAPRLTTPPPAPP